MTDTDFGTFDRALRRLSGAFRLNIKPVQLDELSRTYFKALDKATLDDVMLAGKTCLSTCKRFPTVAEWLAALPAGQALTLPGTARWMSSDDAAEYVRAERLRYQDDPCGCLTCQAADVTDRPLRYVPQTVDERDERVWCPVKQGLVVAGHWAHGDELRRWYDARDRFYGLRRRAPRSLALAVSALVGDLSGAREPGQEG